MNYVIIGPALSGNMGAAAMVLATVSGLEARDPDAHLTLLSYYPEEDRQRAAGTSLTVLNAQPLRLGLIINPTALAWRVMPPLRRLIERRVPEVRALAAADVVLDQGGIAFSDGREKFLIFNLAILFPAFFLGRPVVKCAQALGPFRKRLNRIAAKLALPRVRTIITRGAATQAFVDQLGLTNTELGTDLAFTLHDPVTSPTADDDIITIGIAPSVVVQAKVDGSGVDFVELMVAEIRRHLDAGRHVVVLPHSYRDDPEKVHNNDGPLVAKITARLHHPNLTVRNERLEVAELREIIGSCDVFVSCRFHAMVAALSTGVPTLVLGWSHKYVEVLELFGQADRSIDAGALTGAKLAEATDALIADRVAVAAEIAAAHDSVKALANRQLDRIVEIAGGS